MCDLPRLAGWALFILCGSVSVGAQAADGDEKTQCISASDQGQQLRDEGKYKLAREAFARCARASCPAIVGRDCSAWLFELEARAPTVVFDAKDDKGGDLSDVKVTVDGAPLVARISGLPSALDPGDHVLRYRGRPGFAPVEDHVVIHAGEKNRVLRVRFASAPAPAPTPAGLPHAAPLEPAIAPPAPKTRAIPVAVWAFGGAAVAAFATEAYFGIAGLGQRNNDMSGPDKCAPQCASSERSSIQTKFAIADVSLGAGVVSASLAAYFFFRGRHSAPEAGLDIAPQPHGAVATWGGRF